MSRTKEKLDDVAAEIGEYIYIWLFYTANFAQVGTDLQQIC